MKQFASNIERAHQTRPMPEMPNLNWNQAGRGENHEQLRPALLHVNTDSFREKNRRIKQRQETRRRTAPSASTACSL